MKKGLPEDDVFRWKCVAIVESALEGATYEEVKDALFQWVLDSGGVGDDGPPHNPELTRKYFEWKKANGPVCTEPRITQRDWKVLAEALMVAMKVGETLASVRARYGLDDLDPDGTVER